MERKRNPGPLATQLTKLPDCASLHPGYVNFVNDVKS